MRYLVTLLLAALSLNAFSQNNAIHVYPWNPDANQDNSIGMGDMLSFLSVFGNEFGNPPEPCDYDGTPLEEFFAGLLTGAITLDSMFIEFELDDVSSYFPIGCPNQVTDTVTFAYSSLAIITGSGGLNNENDYYFHSVDENGYFVYVQFTVNTQSNTYSFKIQPDFLGATGLIDDGFFGGNSHSSNWIHASLPFPESWYFDENGLHFSGWSSSQWPYYANYLHILPYWHYADE